MTEQTDSDLINCWLAGQDKAFETLYRRYRLQLYAYLNRLFPGQQSLSDDLFQQTWIRVVDRLPTYEDDGRFLAWVMRIAHNMSMDHFRRQRNHEHIELNETIAGEADDPWIDMDKHVQTAALENALQSLPEEQREVILLRQQGISFKEIATIQGTGINTALGRMHYAINSLQKQLEHMR